MKVTVCMCTYNGETYIREQLDSLVNQTTIPNEIIVFDDCSTDNTLLIINEYVHKFSNITWIVQTNKKNKGWKINFKDAINKAVGDFIFLCDQDDIWMLDKIEKMTKIMIERKEIELLTCNPIVKYEKTGIKKYKYKSNGEIIKILKNSCLTHTALPGCTFCFKKSIIKYFNNIWQEDFPHDSLLWKIAYLRETLYSYNYYGIIWRRHETNATNKVKKQFSTENIKIHYEIILLYNKCFKALSQLPNITENNTKKIKDVIIMLDLRKVLYEKKTLFAFLKLMKYKKYYASRKAYWLDLLAITKFNEYVGLKK